MINRFIPLSIRARLFVLVLLALITPFVLIFYYAVREIRVTSQLTRETALRLVRLGGESQRQTFHDARNLLVLLSGMPGILLDPDACRSALSTLPSRFPQFKNVAVSDPGGRITCSSMTARPGINFSERAWFKRALQTRKFVSSDYLIGKVGREPILVFAMPILDTAGAVKAVISLSAQLNWLNRLSVQADLPPGSVFTVIDRKGTILGHQPDPQKWVGKSFAHADIVRIASSSEQQGTSEAEGIDGVKRFYAYTPLRDENLPVAGFLMIGIPKDVGRADAQAILLRNLVLMTLVAYLVLATIWIAGRKLLLQRLGLLSAAGRRLATGDFTARTGIPQAGDEIGNLAATFDDMAEALESREEEKRRAMEVRARLASIVESTSDAIFTRDLHGIVTNWNRGAEVLFGYSAAEMIGHPIVNLIPADEIESTSRNFESVRRGQNPLTFESVRLCKNNKRIHVSVTLSPVKDEFGQIIGVSSILRDISARKKVEREISALHEISVAMSSTLDLDESLRILLQKIEAVLPYAGSHIRLLNRNTGVMEPVACRNMDEQRWKSEANLSDSSIHARITRSRESVIISELRRHGVSGRRNFYQAHGFVSYLGAPIFVQDEVIGVLSLLTKEPHDFNSEEIQFTQTLAKQAGLAIHNSQLYETVKQQAAALEEATRQQGDFVAMIVHDLRSPLTAIMAIAEMLRDGGFGTVTPDQREWSERILDNANNLVELISDFLDVSKLETGRISLTTCPVDVASLIQKAVEDHGPLAKKRKIQLTYRVEGELFEIAADPRRLDQVFNNLLSNALKFTDPGGRVWVEARFDENNGIRVEVHDTGVGIPRDEIRGLFGKYRQVNSATISEQKGTGLGLVICKMIVEAHGGRIWVESEFGRGSSFIFNLPCGAGFRDIEPPEQAAAGSDG